MEEMVVVVWWSWWWWGGDRMHYNHEILTFEYRNALWTSQRLPGGSNERYYYVGHAGRAKDSIETERARS